MAEEVEKVELEPAYPVLYNLFPRRYEAFFVKPEVKKKPPPPAPKPVVAPEWRQPRPIVPTVGRREIALEL